MALVAEARGLGRRFGRTLVLERVDLQVRAGEVLGLVGPNGGGKSTLLLLLAVLIRPSQGEVLVQGTPAHEVATARTGTVGLITARPGLYPLLTGRENLVFFAGLCGLSGPEVVQRAGPLVDSVRLGRHLDQPVSTYSSGMAQKLSLVRALLLSPALLLLDEPTANLDPLASRAMHVAMRTQADAGVGVVLATHDLRSAESICHRVVLLRGSVLHTEVLQGARRVPEPGRLHTLYAHLAGEEG